MELWDDDLTRFEASGAASAALEALLSESIAPL